MSLISLLIALAVERYLPSANWQFSTFYRYYIRVSKLIKFEKRSYNEINDKFLSAIFILTPTLICYLLLTLVDSAFFSFIVSTLVLIICLGCSQTRDSYRHFLKSAFRGELKTCGDCNKDLAKSKNIDGLGYGQMLIWLNYRYFIAIMFFFVLFGAPGAILYRLLVTVSERYQNEEPLNTDSTDDQGDSIQGEEIASEVDALIDASIDDEFKEEVSEAAPQISDLGQHPVTAEQSLKLLNIIDWILIRIVSFGYMLVGHFSRALPTWLDYVFDAKKPASQLLIDVAQKSEDVTFDEDDCTAEPCMLVRLAKRTLLLCLVVLSLLIVTGVIS